MRTLVDIPEADLKALDATAKSAGISRAEPIRRAISAYIELNRPPAKHAGFGLWQHYEMDTDEYLRNIRAEWDHEWDQGDKRMENNALESESAKSKR